MVIGTIKTASTFLPAQPRTLQQPYTDRSKSMADFPLLSMYGIIGIYILHQLLEQV